MDPDGTLIGLQDAGHALQQRRLARAVVADDPEHLTLADIEGDVLERDELVEAVATLSSDPLLQRVSPLTVDTERLGEVIDLEYGVVHRHISSAKRGESLVKANVPNVNETVA